MAQTDAEKAIARINSLRAEGRLTQAEAQRLRQQVRELDTKKGALGASDNKQITAALSQAVAPKKPSGGSGSGSGGGSRPAAPGRAWTWSDAQGKWVKPPRPNSGPGVILEWDDNAGWRPKSDAKPEPTKPKAPPKPGYEWVWNGSAWIETKLPKDRPPTQTLPDGYEWVWNDSTQSWGFTQTSGGPGPGPDPGPDPDPTEPEEPPERPGLGWVVSDDGARWIKPPKPNDGQPYLWDDELGWVKDPEKITTRASAREVLQDNFRMWGFSDEDVKGLTALVDGWLIEGLADSGSMDAILTRFRGTTIYQNRFAGMAELRARGQAIDEGSYVKLEASYRNAMANYGIDKSYYDNYDDYAKLIGAGLSPDEVEQRVVAAKQAMNPLVAAELKQYYNITDGDLTAYMLGLTNEEGLRLVSARNQEEIRRRGRAAQIGAAAERAGFAMDREYAERLGGTSLGQLQDPFQMGTLSKLEGTFDQARRTADRDSVLAGIDSEAYNQTDAIDAAFGDDQKQLASERRAKRERARFLGSSGASSASLGVQRNI